jgi:hypothetical protein
MLLGDDAGPLCGCLYEGEAADGAPHGYGTLVYASGSMYEGGFVRGRECGKGVLSDGDDVILYQGDMADGAFNGNGELAGAAEPLQGRLLVLGGLEGFLRLWCAH